VLAASELSGGDPVYFNRPGVALVTWNPDLKAVCLESQGWADTSEAQAVLDAIIRALRAHHGSRWLLDGRKMKVVKQADQDWITKKLASSRGGGRPEADGHSPAREWAGDDQSR